MILRTLVEFLDKNQVRYVNATHSTAFTAQDVAESAHISGKEMTVIRLPYSDFERLVKPTIGSFGVSKK